MAPLSLALVSVMLYFFRFVYAEVVTAMPMNGGSYTALNNTTSKRVAALAACLSLVSYVATAVVSAESAVQYLQLLVPALNNQAGTILGTIVVLGIFAILTLLGMSESATVASVMFILHVATLFVLSVWCLVWAAKDRFSMFASNWAQPYPDSVGGNPSLAVFYGYAAALLGITGFETAANYVEEMKDTRVYVSTLSWMWLSASLFNPLLGALSMAVMPLSCSQVRGYPGSPGSDPSTLAKWCQDVDYIYKYQANLLGPVAGAVGGGWFKALVCVDGVIVLAGSVLTAYVGVTGLVRRLALDRCLPSALLQINSCRGTPHVIIIGFFGVTSSLLLILQGDVDMLSSVYNLAFLCVMTAFAIACGVLKWKRPLLSRLVIASPFAVAAALFCVVTGLVGNVLRSPSTVLYFLLYAGGAFSIVAVQFNLVDILKALRSLVIVCVPSSLERDAGNRLKRHLVESHASKERCIKILQARERRAGGLKSDNREEDSEVHQLLLPNVTGVGNREGEEGANYEDEKGDGVEEEWKEDHENLEESGFRQQQQFQMLPLPLYSSLQVGPPTSSEEPLGSPMGSDGDNVSTSSDGPASGIGQTFRRYCLRAIDSTLDSIRTPPLIFFAKDGDLGTLNKAVNYVLNNESTGRLVVVHCVDDIAARKVAAATARNSTVSEVDHSAWIQALEAALPPHPQSVDSLIAACSILDAIHSPKLTIDCLVVRGTAFSPPAVAWVGRHLGVGTNAMLMAMPRIDFPHAFAALGGLRVITRKQGRERRGDRERHFKQATKAAAQILADSEPPPVGLVRRVK